MKMLIADMLHCIQHKQKVMFGCHFWMSDTVSSTFGYQLFVYHEQLFLLMVAKHWQLILIYAFKTYTFNKPAFVDLFTGISCGLEHVLFL